MAADAGLSGSRAKVPSESCGDSLVLLSFHPLHRLISFMF